LFLSIKSFQFGTSKISKDNKVSGFIVGWPLEPSGRPGAACGRVLHILDFLAG
jgi:hypothetical protein